MRAKVAAGIAASALFGALLPTTGAGADSHVTYVVQAGAFLNGKGARQVSMRFFPDEITVRQGDVIHFTSQGTHSATLLPLGQEPDTWRAAYATGDDAPFSLTTADPDEGATERKMNNVAGQPTDPTCGAPIPSGGRLPTCAFDGTGDGQDGVLNSGVPSEGALDFEVSVDVDASLGPQVFWVVDLVNPTLDLQVTVVNGDGDASDPADLASDVQAQVAADAASATDLHKQYVKKIVKKTNKKTGVRTFTAWAGFDEGAISLRAMYPTKLVLNKKDKIAWKFSQLVHQGHSVTFPKPMGLTLGADLPSIVCDLDGAGDQPDAEPSITLPPYCDDPQTVELDLPSEVVQKIGDRKYTAGADVESSGILGGTYGAATKSHVLTFLKTSSKKGFKYTSITHPFMTGKVVVK